MTNPIRIEPYAAELTPDHWELLLLADPDPVMVASYLPDSRLTAAWDGDQLVGLIALLIRPPRYELINLAVRESHQGLGIAKRLIAAVKAEARELGATELEVGTGNAGINQLALYQKCGFRIYGVEFDYFAHYPEPIYENGIRCLDLIRMRADLTQG